MTHVIYPQRAKFLCEFVEIDLSWAISNVSCVCVQIIIVTAISHLANFTDLGVKTVGYIPTGYVHTFFFQQIINLLLGFCAIWTGLFVMNLCHLCNEMELIILSSFPVPSFPPPSRYCEVAGSAFSIAIVAFAVNISMGKLFAKKHSYHLNSNQVCSYLVCHICLCEFLCILSFPCWLCLLWVCLIIPSICHLTRLMPGECPIRKIQRKR